MLCPREMAPGYYDAIVATCRSAGFEPRVEEHGAGSTVWGYIAQAASTGDGTSGGPLPCSSSEH